MSVTLADLVVGDLPAAARRRLLDAFKADDDERVANAQTPLWLAVGGLIGKDGQDGAKAGVHNEGWVFPGLDNEGRPLRPVEGSNKVSVTLLNRDHWNTNQHNTMSMPVLRILIHADTVRQSDGNTAGRYAELRVRKVAEFIDGVFHGADNGGYARTQGWDGPDGHVWNPGKSEELYVIACLRTPGGGLNIMDIPDNDYAVRGDLRYEISLHGGRKPASVTQGDLDGGAPGSSFSSNVDGGAP